MKAITYKKKDTPHHVGPHPLTPPNLVKHVAQPSSAPAPKAKTASKQTLEFGQLDPKYRRTPISEIEMDAIEVNKNHTLSIETIYTYIIIEWWSYCYLLSVPIINSFLFYCSICNSNTFNFNSNIFGQTSHLNCTASRLMIFKEL